MVPDVWATLLGRGLRFVQWRCTRNLVKKRDPVCGRGAAEQGHSKRPGTGPGNANTDHGCILAALRVPSKIRFLRSANVKSSNDL